MEATWVIALGVNTYRRCFLIATKGTKIGNEFVCGEEEETKEAWLLVEARLFVVPFH